MIITKESVASEMFNTTGCTVQSKLITDEEFVELSGLVRLKLIGGIPIKVYSTLFLAGINPILIRNGIIDKNITKLDKKLAINININ